MMFISLVLFIIGIAINLFIITLLINAAVSWLIAFNILKMSNSWVRSLYKFTTAITEPALRPIRRRMPATGDIDFSPLVLFGILVVVMFIIKGLQSMLYAGAEKSQALLSFVPTLIS